MMLAHSLAMAAFLAIPQAAAPSSVAEVAREVERNYERFQAIASMKISLTLPYQHLNGARKFSFNRVEVKTYRKGDKLRLAFFATRSRGSTLAREIAWDGTVGTSNEASAKGGDFSITGQPRDWLFYYNYYMTFLSYPDGLGKVRGFNPPGSAAGRGGWLPQAIGEATGRYTLQLRTDEEGVRCVVLEAAGHEVFWFDPQRGYALRRRDSFDPTTGNLLESTVMRDFRAIEGVWLPLSVVRTAYGGRDDPETTPDQIRDIKSIRVNEISTATIPDGDFRLKAPEGFVIHDAPRRAVFTSYRTGVNPIVPSAELARDQIQPRGTTRVLIALAVGLGILLLIACAWLRHKRRSIPGEGRPS